MKALDLEGLTISEIAPLIRKKQISPLELTRRYLDRIKTLNPVLNAYLAMTEEGASAAAKKAEREISKGNYRGPLHGIPFSIKDNIAIKGVTTTAGSKILADWVPDFDATVVERLKDAGAVILGKTNIQWAKAATAQSLLRHISIRGIQPGSRRVERGSAVAVAPAFASHPGHRQRGSVRNRVIVRR
jgi:Asp-tRNA(Asn)/Glu-tRNA(Gln) amidotransferase A subunit family amidase